MIAAVLIACMSLPPGAQPDGGRASQPAVVCFGDSITKRGYPEILGQTLGVKVVNAGVGGNTTAQALRRISKDVLAHEPDVVVVLFGTNDSRLDNSKVHVSLENYRENLKQIIKRCVECDSRIVLCTIPPVDPTAYFTRHRKEDFKSAGGLAKVLADYRSAVLQVAADQRVDVVDLGELLADEPKWMSADGVHPTAEGNRIIAKHIAAAVRFLLDDSQRALNPQAGRMDASASGFP